MYDNSAEAIFFFDRTGKVLTMNSAAELILNAEVLDQNGGRRCRGDMHVL